MPSSTRSCWPLSCQVCLQVRNADLLFLDSSFNADTPAFLAALPRDQTQIEPQQSLAVVLVLAHLTSTCKGNHDLQHAVVQKFLSLATPSLLPCGSLESIGDSDELLAVVELLDAQRTSSSAPAILFRAYVGIFNVVVSNLHQIAWPDGTF